MFTAAVYNSSLDERSQVNEVMMTVSANDPDGDTVTYSLKVMYII